jgi:C1A family cysteine protease
VHLDNPSLAHGLGWVPDLPDRRDMVMEPPDDLHALPSSVDLRPQDVAPIYNQLALGSCTSNAIAAALRFTLRKQGLADVDPSRLYIYYKERQREHTVAEDAGAMIRDGMKVVATGFVREAEWPYDIATFALPPSAPGLAQLDKDAKRDHVIKYLRVLRDLGMRGCLAAGFPFVMGISVYQSFEQSASGEIPMPAPGEQLLGGHAILCVGYDTTAQQYTFRNSWGDQWGQGGYGTLPFAYLHDPTLSSDFWTVRAEVEA